MVVQQVVLLPCSFRVPGSSLSLGYGLCVVSNVLPMSVWVSSGSLGGLATINWSLWIHHDTDQDKSLTEDE